jgi:hypothetical protein
MSAFAATNGGDVKSSSTGAPRLPVYEVLDAGTKSLLNGDFDDARDQYYAAYLQYPDSKEAIFYSVLVDIVAISADPSIISLMNDRLGVVNYRGITDLTAPAALLKNYRSGNTFIAYPKLSVPQWFESTQVYQEYLDNGEETEDSWFALFFANFIDKNDFNFNHFIDDILNGALGDSFEDIYNRIKKLDFTDRVQIDPRIIAALNAITDVDIEQDTYGRIELEVVAISLRLLKASLEWYASYNWDSDLSFLKTDWYDLLDVDHLLDTLTAAQLPFKNDFLTDRHNGMMSKSKADYRKALDDSIVLYDYIFAGLNSSSYPFLPESTPDSVDPLFIRYILTSVADAIETGGTVWFPPDITGLENEIGFDFGKLFTSGFFALNQLIAQDGSNRRPRFVDQYLDPVIPSEDKRAGFELNISHLKELAPGLWDSIKNEPASFDFVDDLDGKLFLEFTPEVAQKLYWLYY